MPRWNIMFSETPQILIAEDDSVARTMLELYLEQEGYNFVSVPNGEEALKQYNSNYFPIVITDWLMPKMDGIELCRSIRNQTNDRYTFIIMLTSKNSPESLLEGLESGADDYIIKPINPIELRLRLKGCRRILDLESSLKQSLTEIRDISLHDPLTGAFNRAYLDKQLEHEINRAYRYNHKLSLIMCDLDHFKLVNDTYGHQTGDIVLKRCVENITHSIRHQIDWVARYGGEEFIIALPETDAEGCVTVAERMRERISFSPNGEELSILNISASFGTVTLTPDENAVRVSVADLIQRADICLYQAKQSGRNCVVAEFQKDSI